MAKIVFRLRHVPDEEADAVRQLLSDHQIDFYETSAGRWGISMPALWVADSNDFNQARQLIDQFQEQHQQTMRQRYLNDRAEGRLPTFWQLIRTQPLLYLGYWALIIAIAIISFLPILHFIRASNV